MTKKLKNDEYINADNTDGKQEIFKIENEIFKIENEISKIEDDDEANKYEERKSISWRRHTQNQNGSTYYNFNVEPEFEMKFGESSAFNKSKWLEKLNSYKDLTFHPKNTNNEIKIQFLNQNGDQNSAVVKRKCMKKTITASIIFGIILAIFMLMFHNNLLSLN